MGKALLLKVRILVDTALLVVVEAQEAFLLVDAVLLIDPIALEEAAEVVEILTALFEGVWWRMRGC